MKSTGERKVYHLYACPNDLKVHEKRRYIGEDKLWKQLEPAIDLLSISEDFAKDIADSLNETHHKQKAAIRKQMDGFRVEQAKLREERAGAVKLFAAGRIDEQAYAACIEDVDHRDEHYTDEIERLMLTISGSSSKRGA